jgi:transposase
MAEKKSTAEATVKNIHRNTRKKYCAEEKIRIVIEGLQGDLPIAVLCRREGINQNSYYKWSKEFLEAGRQRLAGNTQRQATSEEVEELPKELDQRKLLVAELSLKNRVLTLALTGGAREKSLLGLGDETWNE